MSGQTWYSNSQEVELKASQDYIEKHVSKNSQIKSINLSQRPAQKQLKQKTVNISCFIIPPFSLKNFGSMGILMKTT